MAWEEVLQDEVKRGWRNGVKKRRLMEEKTKVGRGIKVAM